MATATAIPLSVPEARVRSGKAASLAGISASTLRIWEYRYGVVEPPKSESGQRSYSMNDVERLRIIKTLTLDGHTISTLANLDFDALVALSAKPQNSLTDVRKVFVVGRSVALKLEGRMKSQQTVVFEDLNHAERDADSVSSVDLLIVHVRTLQSDLVARIVSLRNKLLRPQTIVLYSFGVESISERLHAEGITCHREPLSGRELVRLIVGFPQIDEKAGYGAPASVRRYSDVDLSVLSDISSEISCECPRHLAEIITLLVAFEEYSNDCGSLSKKDAALHQQIFNVTACARTMLEGVLERVIIEEGFSHLVSS